MANRAVFMDRDRTIIEDPGYMADPSAVRLLPGADLALRMLRQGGYAVVVVTNQSGIARGLLTEEALERIHAEMRRQLHAGGAHVDAIYYCPYHPEGTVEPYACDSDLRKPKPGMLRKAAQDLELDLASSWMVGDSARDVEAGLRAGCRTVRIRAAEHDVIGEPEDEGVQADFTVKNLLEAARLVLQAPPRAARPAPPAGPGPAGEPRGEAGLSDREILLEVLHGIRKLLEDRPRPGR